ncbi:MarR family winged helix-turn-helix transcriptional regulator [Winogradskyella haliclonae]|uniref:MarR family transcriptional regulator n=1 Tax=Winogradskyella haliclonae TaxID=2048558 RepID=A0ABQ2BZC7_9FLAO|nr:MarR family transcriptional regulator [Winogradskyella haliclonae]GGI57584.1 MarR family transcriptional regulator [Winogradskyella haliclonae]
MNKNDIIDSLVLDWQKERSDLDVSAMSVVGRILKLGKTLEKRAGLVLKNIDLYYTDFDVLATLRRSGNPYQLTPKELMESVLITSGAMTSLLERLTKLDLIYRETDEKDKRVKRAILTEKGIKLIDEAVELRFNEANKSIDYLSNDEKKTLSELLKKMILNIE